MEDRELIQKRIHDIDTFMATEDNDTILSGKDEYGKDFMIIFSTLELLEWMDIEYMKKQSKKYINNL
jgi:hypothetical protein